MADTKIVVDCATGVVTEVELTAEEIQQRELDAIAAATAKAEADAGLAAKEALKESAKNKLIAGQPLTAEEASVLVI
jgi:hypothetical protein